MPLKRSGYIKPKTPGRSSTTAQPFTAPLTEERTAQVQREPCNFQSATAQPFTAPLTEEQTAQVQREPRNFQSATAGVAACFATGRVHGTTPATIEQESCQVNPFALDASVRAPGAPRRGVPGGPDRAAYPHGRTPVPPPAQLSARRPRPAHLRGGPASRASSASARGAPAAGDRERPPQCPGCVAVGAVAGTRRAPGPRGMSRVGPLSLFT